MGIVVLILSPSEREVPHDIFLYMDTMSHMGDMARPDPTVTLMKDFYFRGQVSHRN